MSSDENESYTVINRSALILVPTPAFLAWVKAMPGDPFEMTYEEFCEDSTVYLVPDLPDDTEDWMRRNYMPILQQELFDWCTDDSLWPKDLSYETFCGFFKRWFKSVVVDLGNDPIEAEQV